VGRSRVVSFTKARVKEIIRYHFGDQLITDASSFKYLGIVIHHYLNGADVNYTLQKSWNALHFITCILEQGNMKH